LTDFLIGTGGWAYFNIPNINPLEAYSKAFIFVEVNSTFYDIPKLDNVKSWRKTVPPDFEFSVRCNKKLTHELMFELVPEAFNVFEKMTMICDILKSEILHFQTPPSFNYDKMNCKKVQDFFSSLKKTNLRFALEPRSLIPQNPEFVKMIEDQNLVHCVDLLKGIEPIYQSDILYTRLFGKGYHNVYQPLDSELKRVYEISSKEGIQKAIITMHSNRMFKDAARFKIYKESGKFPMVTKSVGVDSLAEVINEDAIFPSSKEELISRHGWKVIDLTATNRVRALELLQKLPEKTYYRVDDIVQKLGRKQS